MSNCVYVTTHFYERFRQKNKTEKSLVEVMSDYFFNIKTKEVIDRKNYVRSSNKRDINVSKSRKYLVGNTHLLVFSSDKSVLLTYNPKSIHLFKERKRKCQCSNT